MEVLNHSQRKNAIFRVIGLGFLVVIVMLLGLLSMRKSYRADGDYKLVAMTMNIDSINGLIVRDSTDFRQVFDSLSMLGEQYDESNNENELRDEIHELDEELIKVQQKHETILDNTREREQELELQLEDCLK